MRRILIACHGRMAEGVITALKIIIGEKEHISYINAYVEDSNLAQELKSYFAAAEKDQEVLVLTDLYGGSVNQSLFAYAQRENVRIVSGFNLALALELALVDPETELSDRELDDNIAICAKQMRRINRCVDTQPEKDDFDI